MRFYVIYIFLKFYIVWIEIICYYFEYVIRLKDKKILYLNYYGMIWILKKIVECEGWLL